MGTEMEQNQNPGQEVERRAGPKDRNSRWDEGLKPGVSGPGSPSLVLGAPLANQRPPPVQAWARVGLGTCSSQSPSLPNRGPRPVDSGAGSPPPAEPPKLRGPRCPARPAPYLAGAVLRRRRRGGWAAQSHIVPGRGGRSQLRRGGPAPAAPVPQPPAPPRPARRGAPRAAAASGRAGATLPRRLLQPPGVGGRGEIRPEARFQPRSCPRRPRCAPLPVPLLSASRPFRSGPPARRLCRAPCTPISASAPPPAPARPRSGSGPSELRFPPSAGPGSRRSSLLRHPSPRRALSPTKARTPQPPPASARPGPHLSRTGYRTSWRRGLRAV
ncbi:atherin-like [Hippopotamus amphibius kiboko]|uniref:atherin-like n=1 Tax=Hippopotamus amphibius kiboko TaxID=575201 RepID=UPI00259ACF97|nr:atherin-like [Hippopotamus amphibius kiboko]